MEIDKLFAICLYDGNVRGTLKEQFYIGRITHISSEYIFAQFENLNASASKILFGESVQPNKIDTFVLIDNRTNILLGKVNQIKLKDTDSVHTSLNQNDDETIYPIEKISIVGSVQISEEKNDIEIKFGGFENPGLTDKVYACPDKIIEKFNSAIYRISPTPENSICFGKFYNSGNQFRISLDDLYQQHLLTVGSTNSGKSTTFLSIMEKSIQKGVKYLILDPTGEYSDSFEGLHVSKYRLGEYLDDGLYVENGTISITQWCEIVNTNSESQPAALNEAIHMLKETDGVVKYIDEEATEIQKIQDSNEHFNNDFDFSLLPEQLVQYASKIKGKKYIKDDFKLGTVTYLIEKIRLLQSNKYFMEIFNNHNKESNSLRNTLKSFYKNNQSVYIDCSNIDDASVMAVFISILIDIIFKDVQDNIVENPFVIYIDEVHRYMCKTSSRESIMRVAREGRKHGVFLSLTTQSPSDIPNILLGQIGTFIIHRISNDLDNQIIMNFLKEKRPVQYLKQGEAIVTSNHLIQDVQIYVEKSKRHHKNTTPSLVSRR